MLALLVPMWQECPLCILSPEDLAVAPSRAEPSPHPRREMDSAERSPALLQELGGLMMEYGGDWRGFWRGRGGGEGDIRKGHSFWGMERGRMVQGRLMDEGQSKGGPRVD